MHTHARVQTHTDTGTDTHTDTLIRTHTQTYKHTCMHARPHARTHTSHSNKPGKIHRTHNILSQVIYTVSQCDWKVQFGKPNLLYIVNGRTTYNL